MAATMTAVPSAMQGFSVFLIPYHASDCKPHGRSYDCQNNNCTHVDSHTFLIIISHAS